MHTLIPWDDTTPIPPVGPVRYRAYRWDTGQTVWSGNDQVEVCWMGDAYSEVFCTCVIVEDTVEQLAVQIFGEEGHGWYSAAPPASR